MIIWSEVTQEVLKIAQDLIKKYHPGLEDSRIGFVFRSEAGKSGGKFVVAKAAKVPEKYQPLNLEIDFLIWIAFDTWVNFDTNQRQALIDHELYHCTSEDGTFKLRGHDVEEFAEVIKRWGMWNSSLMDSAAAFEKALQLDLGLRTAIRGAVVSVQPEFMQMPVKEE